MASGVDTPVQGGSLPFRRAPPSSYRRGFSTSTRRFPMPAVEENQFILKLDQETRHKLPVTDDEEEEKKEGKKVKRDAWVTLLVQSDRLVVVRKGRSWGWRLGCIRRYGWSTSLFYFESGRKSMTGNNMYNFITDSGERIHSRITIVKEFCQFDLYCQRGVLLDLLFVNDPPARARSLKDKNERRVGHNDKKGEREVMRKVSTGSLP